ncbi:MAG: hypothetical protein MPL62_06425 [Alphaproteobacteria bacterium]|nr:hypothetical protein [Alphaproteobacteria bacterium]
MRCPLSGRVARTLYAMGVSDATRFICRRLENADARPYITFEKSGVGGAPFLRLLLLASPAAMFRAKH